MTPVRARRKVTEVEAMQWLGVYDKDFAQWGANIRTPSASQTSVLWVAKSKSWCALGVGHWVIKEADGTGFYPCAQFDDFYEVIPEADK